MILLIIIKFFFYLNLKTLFEQTNKTSLYLASWNGHSEVVQLLLSKDVELEVQDDVSLYNFK